ncbi:MAG: DNA primase, partial [Gammaproteobacteria bacterium]|nr:DNA primase [Gammaproteobacteria bacterium]
FPERELQHGKPERRPFPAADVLRCVIFEALVVATAAESMAGGEALTQTDLDRLRLASARLQAAREAYRG